jgi:predicted phosphodiesterase
MSRIVFATDLHLTEGQGGLAPFTTDLQEISTLSPDLLVMGGDICLWETGAGDQLQHLLGEASFPTVCVMGNHDTDRAPTDREPTDREHTDRELTDHDPPASDFDRDFSTRFGPRNRHVDLGDAHIVVLNTCRMDLGPEGWRNARAEVGTEDLAWLDATLAGLTDDRPLLMFVHIPLATTYPERRSADQATTDVWRVTNADAVFERLHAWTSPVIVCQGHLHENEHLHVEDLHLISVGSVCGRWWQQGPVSRCTDNGPRGWLVLDVTENAVELDYHAARSTHWHGEIVGRSGDADQQLNLFFADPAQIVEVRLPNDTWQALATPSPIAVDDKLFSVHHWALPANFIGDAVEVRTRMRGRR